MDGKNKQTTLDWVKVAAGDDQLPNPIITAILLFGIVPWEKFYQSLLVSLFSSLQKFTQRQGLAGFTAADVEIYTYQSVARGSIHYVSY